MSHDTAPAQSSVDTTPNLLPSRIKEPFWFGGQLHLLTLTFRYDFHVFTAREIYDKTVWDVTRNMKRVCGSSPWRAYPELTQKGMLHWHILLITTNFITLKAFRGFWDRMYGSSHCEKVKMTIDDFFCTWFYIRKDSRAMMKILKLYKPMLINPSSYSYQRIRRTQDARAAKHLKISKDLDTVIRTDNILSLLLIRDDLSSPLPERLGDEACTSDGFAIVDV